MYTKIFSIVLVSFALFQSKTIAETKTYTSDAEMQLMIELLINEFEHYLIDLEDENDLSAGTGCKSGTGIAAGDGQHKSQPEADKMKSGGGDAEKPKGATADQQKSTDDDEGNQEKPTPP